MAMADEQRKEKPNNLARIQNAPPYTVVCLVAMKIDMSEWINDDSVQYFDHPTSDERISSEEGQAAAEMIGGRYFEVDLNTGEGR
jgi:hypothetical protein